MSMSTAATSRRRRVLFNAIETHFNAYDEQPLSQSAVDALIISLEAFLQGLSHELGSILTNDNRSHATCNDVLKSLREMKLHQLTKDANDYLQNKSEPADVPVFTSQPKKKKYKNQKLEFTQEQIDEQERLLAASRKKMDDERGT